MIEKILNKVKRLDMGHALNKIQDTAEKVLTPTRWNVYLRLSSQDIRRCDGMDGLLLNGEYFDWKEFNTKKDNIVKAFLRYFTDAEILLISNTL